MKLEKVELRQGGGSIRAKLKLLKAGQVAASAVTVKRGDDLFAKSGDNEAYREWAAHPVIGKHLTQPAEKVHDGYFSGDKTGWKDTSGTTKADTNTYELIMKDKERLLSPDEPLQFIFSHSALKEGWDNPNVFQICTLRDMGTDTERRQTLGRGLRLARDANGAVIHDPQVNRLTVICNEAPSLVQNPHACWPLQSRLGHRRGRRSKGLSRSRD